MVVTNPAAGGSGNLPGGYTYVVLNFVYYSSYPDLTTTSYWKSVWTLQENLPPGGAGYSDGGWTDKYETRVYSDAACTTPINPQRTATVTITIYSPGYNWFSTTDRQLRQQYSAANALGSDVTNYVYFRAYTPSSFGKPYALPESWTFTKQIDSSNSMGDKTSTGVPAAIAAATEVVTVPAGTFTCYKLTYTISSKTIVEYWDATNAFPYVPIKIVDSINFGKTDTRTLQSSNVLP